MREGGKGRAALWWCILAAAGGLALLTACGGAPQGTKGSSLPASSTSKSGTSAPPAAYHLPNTTQRTGIAFADRHTGWLLSGQDIWGTTDGGRHWSLQQRTRRTLLSVQALDADQAFVLGRRELWGTTDGGRHWQRLGEPAGKPLGRVLFLTDRLGYGLAGRWYATADGGRTWTPLSRQFPSEQVCLTRPGHVWALNWTEGAGGGVLHSTDGGANWRQSLALTSQYPGGLGNGGVLTCAAPGNVWALLRGGVGMNQGSYALYHRTAAGGWRAVAALSTAGGGRAPGNPRAPTGPGDYFGPLAVANADTAYLLGICPACGMGTATLGGTRDGGRTWRNLPKPIPLGSGYLISEARVAFVSPRQGWIVAPSRGAGVEVLRTRDAGASWHGGLVQSPTLRADEATVTREMHGCPAELYGPGGCASLLTAVSTPDGHGGTLYAVELNYSGGDDMGRGMVWFFDGSRQLSTVGLPPFGTSGGAPAYGMDEVSRNGIGVAQPGEIFVNFLVSSHAGVAVAQIGDAGTDAYGYRVNQAGDLVLVSGKLPPPPEVIGLGGH